MASKLIQQSSFASGVVSKDFAGLISSAIFQTSCRTLKNMLITRSNGVTQRGSINHVKDYDLSGQIYFFRTTKILVSGSFINITLIFHGDETDSTLTVLNTEDFSVLHTQAYLGIPGESTSGWDLASYDQYVIITRGSSGHLPIVFYHDGTSYLVENLADMYGVGDEFDGLTAPNWKGTIPVSVAFMLSRFIFVGRNSYYGSEAGAPFGFSYRELASQEESTETIVTSSSAYYYIADNQDDSGFKWIRGGLFAMGGSARGAWIMSNFETGLDATNPNIKNYSGYGAADLPAVYIDGFFFYFDASNRSPRIFTVDSNGPTSIAVGEYSEQIFKNRTPKQIVLQTVPQNIIWILMDDGELVSFQHEQTTEKKAWAEHSIRNSVIESIGMHDDRHLVCLVNRNGYRYFAKMDSPTSDSWHQTVDAFYISNDLLPDTAYVCSASREDETGKLELTVNGPIEDNRPYKVINSGGLSDAYYMVEYAIDPSSQPNEIKKVWLKTAAGEYVMGTSEDSVALDPRGYEITAVADSGGFISITVQGEHTLVDGVPILLQFNDGLGEEYYLVHSSVIGVGETSLTLESPLNEVILYDAEIAATGTVMFDVPYTYTNSLLDGDTLVAVTDRYSFESVTGDADGVFAFAKPYMAAVLGEPIDAVIAPRFFTDILGPHKGRVICFYPYVINTPGLRYGIAEKLEETFEYDEIEAYTGPSKRLSLGAGATPDCNFWVYSSPGSRLEISHMFYEVEVV